MSQSPSFARLPYQIGLVLSKLASTSSPLLQTKTSYDMTTSPSGYTMPVTFSQFQGGVYRNKPSSYVSRYQGRHIIGPRAGVNLGVLVFRRVAGKYIHKLLYEQDKVTPQAYQLPCFSPPGNGKKIYPYLLRKLRSLLGREFIGLAL